MPNGKKRVVILGGGVGAMTAAFELSNATNRDHYDITVYQMGWRLGGQGASGRNQEKCKRIEEHGLHAWGGFYENAFRIMRECYEELSRPAGVPLARIWDPANPDATDVAFKPHSNVVFCEFAHGKWVPWSFPFQPKPGLPGVQGTPVPEFGEMVRQAIRELLKHLPGIGRMVGLHFDEREAASMAAAAEFAGIDPAEVQVMTAPAAYPEPQGWDVVDGVKAALKAFFDAFKNRETAPPPPGPGLPPFIQWLKDLGQELENSPILDLLGANDVLRRAIVLLDFIRVLIVGAFTDDIVHHGFDPLEDFDFTDWLQRHGALAITLQSVLVRGFYDYMFAFVMGDPGRPRMSAGMALWHALRLTCGYRGSIFWLMQAGMGDTVFAPFYLVLKKRGVKFKFFHRVDSLVASADTREITTIEMTRQMHLKGGDNADYNPLFSVKGLDCWPNQPLWDQIEYGPTLASLMQKHEFDPESPLSTLDADMRQKCETRVTQRAGDDFDLVISNISVAALQLVSEGLLPANPKLAVMFQAVSTVQTMAVQVWFRKTFEELGWADGEPVLTGYQRPNSTWGAMSHLLPREEWEMVPPPDRAKAIAYFCGPYYDPNEYQPGSPYSEWLRSYQSRVEAVARQWFQDNAHCLFPKATRPYNPTALCYEDLCYTSASLVIVKGGDLTQGLARFNNQYFRGNCNPCDRYVIALPGDRTYRPREGDSGIANLYFVGDWIYTGLGGCVESAAMSALMVVRRLTGSPQIIPGELPQTRLGYPPKKAKEVLA